MNLKKIALITAIASSFAVVSLPSVSGPGHHGKKHEYVMMKKHHKMMKLMKKLDLSDEQKLAIHRIFDNTSDSAESIHMRMKELKKSFKEAMHEDPINENKIRQLAEEQANAKVDLKLLHKSSMKQMKAELTAEQLEKLEAIKKKHKDKKKRHHHDG